MLAMNQPRQRIRIGRALLAVLALAGTHLSAADWTQFRGPGAMGNGGAGADVPLHWTMTSNIVWKTVMPGPGASSPIVIGDRVFITCSTGSPSGGGQTGAAAALQRHLLCLNLADGKVLWDTATAAELPEQERIREDHGYASSTPVADAHRVYAFYGKSGVFAFDHSGRQLWRAMVGDKLNGWGSAASLVLYKDLVLVNASVESESLVALDKRSGKEIWRASGTAESWHAPTLVDAPGGKTEIVIAKNGQVIGLDADTGASLWNVKTGIPWYMCPTPVAENGIVYVIGGRSPNGALAIRSGGRGDVTASHMAWKLGKGSNVPSPILHDGHLYFAHENLGLVYCVNAKTGALVYEERLEPSPGQVYASPVMAGGRIYYTGRGGRTVVLAASPKFERLADNTLESNRGMFNATPALAGSHLLLRSDKAVYCIGR